MACAVLSILPHPLGTVEARRPAIAPQERTEPLTLSLSDHRATKTRQVVRGWSLAARAEATGWQFKCYTNLAMRLKTKLLLASSGTVLVVLGLSERIAYSQMYQFLRGHEMRIASEMNHG